jgi:hypothetical protein
MPNLPLAVIEQGGAVVEVLSWNQHADLSTETQYEIGHAVGRYDWLNTVERVDMLADIASFFGEPLDRLFIELVALYGAVERVYFALEALYELGERSRKGSRRNLVWLLDFLNICDEEHVPVNDVETLDRLAQRYDDGIYDLLSSTIDEALAERRALDAPDQDEEDDDS